MSQHLTVDRDACAGHGLCYGTAPTLLDADDQGDPVVLHEALADDDLPMARKVVGLCPERALALTEA